MANIYELTADMMKILSMMDDPDLDQQTLKDTMEGIEGAYEDKFDGYAAVIRQLTGYINELEEEKKRIDARKESFENNVKKMKKIMLESMNATGKTKFKTAKNSFWTQKNKASVVIDAKSVWDIPEDFRRYKDPEPDKTKIGEAIAAGQDFTGIAHMEQTESIRIK
jgi:hypothetical protein